MQVQACSTRTPDTPILEPPLMQMHQAIEHEQGGHSDEHYQRHLHSWFAVHLRNEVRCRDVDGYSGGHGQSVADGMLADGHGEYARDGRQPQQHGSEPGPRLAQAARQHHRSYGEALGYLVQENGEKDNPAEPWRDEKAGGDGDAVEEGVDQQSKQYRHAPV